MSEQAQTAPGAGRRIPWFQRLRFWLEILRVYRASNLQNADSQLTFHKRLREVIAAAFGPGPGQLRLLEIGCGQRASQTILFTADGFDAIGIDLEVPTFRITPGDFRRLLRLNGWSRALKSSLRHLLFDREFFRRLASGYGHPLDLNRVQVRVMDAARLEFPNDYFDFIYSSLVFEHIDDVPAAVREMNRVLKPGGRAWINIHLFPSLSGGHHPEWTQSRDPADIRVPPWDHLRDQQYPVDSHLNQLRLADYRRIFQAHSAVLAENTVLETAAVLTPELAELLAAQGYTREDLLTREIAFLCQKKSGRTATI